MLSGYSIVSLSRTVRPRTPWGVRWIRQRRTLHPLTAEGGHTPFVKAGVQTFDTGAVAVKPDPRCSRAIPGGWVVKSGKIRGLVVFSNHSAFHWRSAQSAVLQLSSSDELMSCCVAGTYGCLGLKLGGQVNAEWSRWHDVLDEAQQVKSPRKRKLSAGVGHRHPVTVRKASVMTGLMSEGICHWMDQS